MNYILFDLHKDWENLLPLTFTRPISELRVGILTIKEKWDKLLNTKCNYLTEEYLQEKYQQVFETNNIYINASVIPNKRLVEEISKLKLGQILVKDNLLISACTDDKFTTIEETVNWICMDLKNK